MAALGFEPTANVNGGAADHALEDGEATLERLTAQTVSVDERPADGGSDSSEERGSRGSNGNGKAGAGNGLGPPGPGTRPNSRRGRNGSGPKAASSSSSAVAAAKAAASTTASFAAEAKQAAEKAKNDGASNGNGTGSNGAGVVDAGADAVTQRADNGFTPPGPLVEMPAAPKPPAAPSSDGAALAATVDGLVADGPAAADGGSAAEGAASPDPWAGHHIMPDLDTTAPVPDVTVESPVPPVVPVAPPPSAPAVPSMDFDATRPAGFRVPTPPPPPGSGDVVVAAPEADAASASVGVAGGLAARAGLRGGAGGVATDLASRVPQLVEETFRKRSRVRARKVRRVVRHIDPWSVLAFSVLFHLCVFASLLLASVLVWNAADAAGTIDNIESFIRELGDYTTYEINGDAVFRAAMIIAGVMTLASSVMVVLLTVVFNLISDLIGGIRITVVEEEVVKVHRNRNQ